MDQRQLLVHARGLAKRYEVLTRMDYSLTFDDLVSEAALEGVEAQRDGASDSLTTLRMRRCILDRCRKVRYRRSAMRYKLNYSGSPYAGEGSFEEAEAVLLDGVTTITEGGVDVRRAAQGDDAFAALLAGWSRQLYAEQTRQSAWVSAKRWKAARSRASALLQE